MTTDRGENEYGLRGSEEMDATMRRRRASSQANFLLPHLKPGMSLVDIGCGQGTITVDLAAAVAPGAVLGFDLQEAHLESARRLAAERCLDNVRFELGDIYQPPCEPESFDAAYANAVFFHLAEPERALAAVFDILRPGGILAVRDTGVNDLQALVYEGKGAAAARRAFEIVVEVMVATSRNPYEGKMGLVMNRLCREAGFEVLDVVGQWEIHLATETAAVQGERLPIEGAVGERAIELGFTTREEIDELAAAVRSQRFADPDAYNALPWFAVVARKP